TAAVIGVSPELLSIVAGIEAHEAFLLATGRKPNLEGKLMAIDISSLGFDVFDISRVENCRICGKSRAKE
ncbi:MAG: 4-methyl-5(B-hydroxyethyl)-thiazole monophosphate biosynthesis protein, partial [Candidatus Thorarchaeota archaeon]|nr:4-methyl-5(B-hydroxyethyl)-thiazole monophosphate biosynthesis protein [Candidatus Thorarchaeota archaeon]